MDDDFSEIEIICFDLFFAANRTRFFVIYRPPNSDSVSIHKLDLVGILSGVKWYYAAVIRVSWS